MSTLPTTTSLSNLSFVKRQMYLVPCSRLTNHGNFNHPLPFYNERSVTRLTES